MASGFLDFGVLHSGRATFVRPTPQRQYPKKVQKFRKIDFDYGLKTFQVMDFKTECSFLDADLSMRGLGENLDLAEVENQKDAYMHRHFKRE